MICRVFHFGLNISPPAEFPRVFSVSVLEAAFRRFPGKKLFSKILQNSQENTYVRVSFLNNVAGIRLAQNIGLLKHANFLTNYKKIRAKHKFVNKYSATKITHLYFML